MYSPQTAEGSTNSIKRGVLKRRLPAVILARLDPLTPAASAVVPFRLQLKNISGDLNCHICGSFSSPTDGSPINPAFLGPGAVTMQLTPSVLTPNAGRIFLRPVFQDPTAAQNENHPLPQDLPFGWEFQTEADEVYIDVNANQSLITSIQTGLDGQLLVQVTVEYNGQWWDIKAAQEALSRVILQGSGGTPFILGTAGA